MTPPSKARHAERFARLPRFEGEWKTMVVELNQEAISTLGTTLEAYDNLALIRTPIAGKGRVHLYFNEQDEPTVRNVLRSIDATTPVHVLSVERGMKFLDELWES